MYVVTEYLKCTRTLSMRLTIHKSIPRFRIQNEIQNIPLIYHQCRLLKRKRLCFFPPIYLRTLTHTLDMFLSRNVTDNDRTRVKRRKVCKLSLLFPFFHSFGHLSDVVVRWKANAVDTYIHLSQGGTRKVCTACRTKRSLTDTHVCLILKVKLSSIISCA